MSVDLEALTGHTPGPYVRYEPEDGIGCYWVEHLPEGSVAYETKNGVAAFGQAVFAVPIFNGRETANLLAAAPDLLAEVRALRAERDALISRGPCAPCIAERDALRDHWNRTKECVAELTAERDRWKLADRDNVIRVAELERLGDQLHGNLMGTLLHQPGCDCVCHRDLEAWRKAVRG